MFISHLGVGIGTWGVGSLKAIRSMGISSNIRMKKCLLSDSEDAEVSFVDEPADGRAPLAAVIFVAELVVVEEGQYYEHEVCLICSTHLIHSCQNC